jgi:RNA polymerase sigma-70 factor, ECF subfamily
MHQTNQERAWVEASIQGDPAAFENLIRQHQRMVHALTFRMTGSVSDSEDLAQEAFIEAYRQLPRFRGECSFSSWLYRIAVNKCLNWRKREARRREIHQTWADEDPGAGPDADPRGALVRSALMKLDAKQRAAIVLTVFDGFNHAEAARALGCSETTVSWRIFAARKKLKKWIESNCQNNE